MTGGKTPALRSSEDLHCVRGDNGDEQRERGANDDEDPGESHLP